MRDGSERRRYGRIQLDFPILGRLGDTRVKVMELSMSGFLVAHESRLAPGGVRTLKLDWHGSKFELSCEIVRSTLGRLSRSAGEKSIYHSGLRITGVSREAFETLREVIADRIVRAMEEQKANARGIPPLAAYMYQPEKTDLYRRCEFIDGVWRKTETIHPKQPDQGFTVSAEVEPRYVDLLCETWRATTSEGRRLTRLFAELSISQAEGVPTRRYVP